MTYKKILSWAVVLLWMAVIFSLSSQVAEQSDQLSGEITEVIVQAIEKAVPKTSDIDVDSLNHIVRKNAHFFTYLVLGLLLINALRNSGMFCNQSIILALVVCILYAVSDEIHQLFVPGRGCQVKDVIIDTAGAAVGVWAYMAITRALWKRKTRNE